MVPEEKKLKCRNPDCAQMTDHLFRAKIQGTKMFYVCDGCYKYAKKTGKFRTRQMVDADTGRERAAPARQRAPPVRNRNGEGEGNVHCANPNCRTIYMDGGRYHDGKHFCNACCVYAKRHNGEYRTKEIIAAYLEKVSRPRETGVQVCQCGRKVPHLIMTAIDEGKFLHVCNLCHASLRRSKKLRTNDMELKRKARIVEKSDGKRKRRRVVEDSEDEDEESDGEEILKALKWQKCPNPHCGKMVQYLSRTEINGEGTLHLCHACYCYGRVHHEFRPTKVMRITEDQRMRQRGLVECHNPHCRRTDFSRGFYAKHNHQLYCIPCGRYADTHDGENRPREMVERANLARIRNDWVQNHPIRPRQ